LAEHVKRDASLLLQQLRGVAVHFLGIANVLLMCC